MLSFDRGYAASTAPPPVGGLITPGSGPGIPLHCALGDEVTEAPLVSKRVTGASERASRRTDSRAAAQDELAGFGL